MREQEQPTHQTDVMHDFITYSAKAVAALITPWLVLAAAWLSVQLGVDITVDPTVVVTALGSIFTAIAVWFTRNQVTNEQVHASTATHGTSTPYSGDRRDEGRSAVELLAVIVIVVLCVLGVLFLFGRT